MLGLTESGYQLYAPEMKTRCDEIKTLKEQRLTLEEIKRPRSVAAR